MRPVAITGIGIASSLGVGVDEFWQNLCRGDIGLHTAPEHWSRYSRSKEFVVGLVPGISEFQFRSQRLALTAATEALRKAGKTGSDLRDGLVYVGTGGGELDVLQAFLSSNNPPKSMPTFLPCQITTDLCEKLGCEGAQTASFVNACAAGATAVALASDEVAAGKTEIALAGGVEVLSAMLLTGFQSLRALSPKQCMPFSKDRVGTILAEGSAFVVLEPTDGMKQGLAQLSGWGISNDAYHPTRPDRDGRGAMLAMVRALSQSGLGAADIDYVCAHGTGTPANDRTELIALQNTLGGRLPDVPISSQKGQTGHTAAASGVFNLITSVMAIQNSVIPGTVPFSKPDAPFEHLDFVPNVCRPGDVRVALSNSFGFGGSNVSLVVSSSRSSK